MPNKSLVVMFLLAFLSAGMLSAQPAVGQIPTYVYSTEVTPSAQPGEYDLTVTAVFSPRTGAKKVELVLEKYTANVYYGQWIGWQYKVPATFGDGYTFPYSTGKKVVATYANLRAGVYSLNDGVMRSVVVVGVPEVGQVPDFSDTSRFLYSRNDGGQLTIVTENRQGHPSYVMVWQSLGTMVASGFDTLLTTPIGVFTIGSTTSLQSQPLNVVVCDVVMHTCTTTLVPVRDPFVGGKK